VWPYLEFASLLPLVLRRVFLPLSLGYSVVAERYVVDSVVTIAYIVGDPTFVESKLARIMLRLIPPGTVLVYLRADYATILRRRREDAHGPDFIGFQVAKYDELAGRVGCSIIETQSRTIQETQKALREILLQAVNRSG